MALALTCAPGACDCGSGGPDAAASLDATPTADAGKLDADLGDSGAVDATPGDIVSPDHGAQDGASLDLIASDAQSPDGFALDASLADRSVVDAAVADSMVVDAQAADLGVADSSVGDSNPGDGAIWDSNPGDLGVADAGVEDAAQVCSLTALEQALTAHLEQTSNDVDFSLLLERPDGQRYTFNRGASTPQTVYESASTSKMVTAVILLRLVEQGTLSLADRPQDHITLWPIAATDTLFHVTLAQLLSFTSGLYDEPACINLPNADFANCARRVGENNAGTGRVPGQAFHYSGSHMQVAGLMAIRAKNVSSWQDIFTAFQNETGMFPSGSYDLPSASNPRLAGGMHWTGEEYLAFLRALRAGELLGEPMMVQQLADQTAAAVIESSPAFRALGEDWHYGFGLWHECASSTYNCEVASRVSSAGAYGAYPFWDRSVEHIGFLAQQNSLGSGFEGVLLVRSAQPAIEAWVQCQP
ncbi:MAG: serine hydrolase [Pseudomonadota bacterium]